MEARPDAERGKRKVDNGKERREMVSGIRRKDILSRVG